MANGNPNHSNHSNHSRKGGWGPRTRHVDATRERLRAELGKFPTQRVLCKALGISPKILGRCIQKIEGRTPLTEKQGARKGHFDQKLFRGLCLVYLTGRRDGTLSGVAEENFHEHLIDMLMLVPEYRKIMRTCMPIVLDPENEQ
jgi:methylphosphotriester-DNA--protein-cysteine methyltransferase